MGTLNIGVVIFPTACHVIPCTKFVNWFFQRVPQLFEFFSVYNYLCFSGARNCWSSSAHDWISSGARNCLPYSDVVSAQLCSSGHTTVLNCTQALDFFGLHGWFFRFSCLIFRYNCLCFPSAFVCALFMFFIHNSLSFPRYNFLSFSNAHSSLCFSSEQLCFSVRFFTAQAIVCFPVRTTVFPVIVKLLKINI